MASKCSYIVYGVGDAPSRTFKTRNAAKAHARRLSRSEGRQVRGAPSCRTATEKASLGPRLGAFTCNKGKCKDVRRRKRRR